MYREDCPCPETDCERHCYRDECRVYHGAKGNRPYCDRPPGFFARLFKSIGH